MPLTVPAVVRIPTIVLLQLLIVGLTRVDGFVRTENPSAGVGRDQIASSIPPIRPSPKTLPVGTRPDPTRTVIAYTKDGVNRKG